LVGLPEGTEYPFDYYSIEGVFCEGVGPPGVHVHVDRYDVKDMKRNTPGSCVEIEEIDEDGFAEWLRALFTRKDEMMVRFKGTERLEKEGGADEGERIDVVVCPKVGDWLNVFGVLGCGSVIGRGLIWIMFSYLER
jgi:hypothetical protein